MDRETSDETKRSEPAPNVDEELEAVLVKKIPKRLHTKCPLTTFNTEKRPLKEQLDLARRNRAFMNRQLLHMPTNYAELPHSHKDDISEGSESLQAS